MLERLEPQAFITTHFLAFAARLEQANKIAESRLLAGRARCRAAADLPVHSRSGEDLARGGHRRAARRYRRSAAVADRAEHPKTAGRGVAREGLVAMPTFLDDAQDVARARGASRGQRARAPAGRRHTVRTAPGFAASLERDRADRGGSPAGCCFQRRRARQELEQERATLIDRVRRESGAAEPDRNGAGYSSPNLRRALGRQVRGRFGVGGASRAAALAATLARPTVYVRGPLARSASSAGYRRRAQPRRSKMLSCFVY